MTALYALPDHEVIADLLPAIGRTHVSGHAGLERIESRRGIVPVAIDPRGDGKIMWADVGAQPFREWQFMYTIHHLAEKNAVGDVFTTPVDVLADDAFAGRGLYPTGFVFHISRCGSTLLAKALARSPHNLVINQGGPLQRGFWAYITHEWRHDAVMNDENFRLFRNLVLALTRQRTDLQQKSFVKFISWNVLYLDFITRAFPDVPCLFLYRDPVEVIASVLQETTAVLLAKGEDQATFLTGRTPAQTRQMSDVRYLARCYARYFETVLALEDRITCLNYTRLNSERFQDIISRGLGYEPGEDELGTMQEQFRYHSKDDTDVSVFKPDSARKHSMISPADRQIIEEECAGFIEALDTAPHNLFSKTTRARSAASA